MDLFEHPSFDGHERVVFAHDRDSGLRAIIAVHDSTSGPALGGTRFWPYASSDEALTDVLRLSRGMTFKQALAGLPFGGGKSVIIGDPKALKSDALWHAFGRAVDGLGGLYVCAEDVGTTPADMALIRRATPHVAGLPNTTGDPSPFTARGVLRAMQAAVRYRFGKDDMTDLKVAIQGAGNVARNLTQELHALGATLFVTDIDDDKVAEVVRLTGATVVAPNEILDLEVDVLAPCALGAVLNDETVGRIRAPIICGGANNQLASDADGIRLAKRGVLFVPDFLANAGGVIHAASERLGRDAMWVDRKVDAIGATCLQLLELADRRGMAPHAAAELLARDRLEIEALAA